MWPQGSWLLLSIYARVALNRCNQSMDNYCQLKHCSRLVGDSVHLLHEWPLNNYSRQFCLYSSCRSMFDISDCSRFLSTQPNFCLRRCYYDRNDRGLESFCCKRWSHELSNHLMLFIDSRRLYSIIHTRRAFNLWHRSFHDHSQQEHSRRLDRNRVHLLHECSNWLPNLR